MYTADTSWSKTFILVVTGTDWENAEVKQILADYYNLIDWLQAFRVLKPISDTGVSSCFVARLKESEYEPSDDLLATKHLYACNCETFIHYALCKHCVAKGLLDGVIKKVPAKFCTSQRTVERTAGRPPQSARNPLGQD